MQMDELGSFPKLDYYITNSKAEEIDQFFKPTK